MAHYLAPVGGTTLRAICVAAFSLYLPVPVFAQDPEPFDEAAELAFEKRIEERLELEPVVVSVRGEALEIELAFHGDLTFADGSVLPWDAPTRQPYVRAARRWLDVLRGVQGQSEFRITLHFIGLSFDFGNGFASPMYESLTEIDGNWMPGEALIGINTMLYTPEVRDRPDTRKEHYDNALHEMGHAFGIGSLWNLALWDDEIDGFAPQDLDEDPPQTILRQLVTDSEANGGLIYRGPEAVRAFQTVHDTELDFVPISSDSGHLYAHFDEEPVRHAADGSLIPATDHELMSHRDILSAISVGFLADMGWEVDPAGADPLPGSTPDGGLSIIAPGDDPLADHFTKRVDVFGSRVLATARTSDRKLLHAASMLAEYLDNDEDGVPDDPLVARALHSQMATLVMFWSEEEAEQIFRKMPWDDLEGRALQDLYDEETHPAGHRQGRFDAAYEEVLHLVTHAGYAVAYPETFGEEPGTVLADLMDAARGGRHRDIPDRYPESAWYTYDDETCEYGCQVTEYIYWGLTSLLGAQAFESRLRDIQHEWRFDTPEKVEAGDPGLHALLTDPRWNLPRNLPDGQYAKKATAQF